MTQRTFDVENEKDMADLWDILPNYIDEIRGLQGCTTYLFSKGRCELNIPENLIKIRWHDKSRLIRPIKIEEATKEDIGKLCKFWDKKEEKESICILSGFEYDGEFVDDHSWCWSHCRRLTKQEIEELC